MHYCGYDTNLLRVHIGINSCVGKKSGERHEFSKDELEIIDRNYNEIISKVKEDLFNA